MEINIGQNGDLKITNIDTNESFNFLEKLKALNTATDTEKIQYEKTQNFITIGGYTDQLIIGGI
tara:strand:- start:46 stop:237 length:192 start_codon:yes stop_codon:yes gene_type:complete